ncbi:MAG: M20/M25/M40 family metallo-hydrolase [Chloroflexi bacterium]|nr:M20/M25/M40 family metallo-hydrolase [Chloroflexota bacterium]
MSDLVQFLKEMISAPGLSGYETPVREIIADRWRPLVDELRTSRLGSLEGLRKGRGAEPRPSLLLAAHMDAIGLIVSGIAGEHLRFTEIGGVDPRILPGQPVLVHGRRPLPGVIVQPPAGLLPPDIKDNPVPMERLWVDVGLTSEEVANLVHSGDLISFAQPPIDLSGNILSGHTMDDRVSVAAVTFCLEELQTRLHAWDIWAVATVQEETSFGGAYTSTFGLNPDMGIAIDVTHAKGPGTSEATIPPLGKGLVLGIGPNSHPFLFKKLKELAEELEIPYHIEPYARHSGTDAYAIQVTAEGKPSMVISIPLRYMHTPVETVSIKDIKRVGRLLAAFITSLDDQFLQQINWEA